MSDESTHESNDPPETTQGDHVEGDKVVEAPEDDEDADNPGGNDDAD